VCSFCVLGTAPGNVVPLLSSEKIDWITSNFIYRVTRGARAWRDLETMRREQPGLFNEPEPSEEQSEPSSPLESRFAVAAATYEFADDEWKECYEAFVLEYLTTHESGTAEDIRLAFEEDESNPQPGKSKRASGQIFIRLHKAKRIYRVGKERSRIYGNDLTVYARRELTNGEL
jgi:hypothetical protein